jgi:azurin
MKKKFLFAILAISGISLASTVSSCKSGQNGNEKPVSDSVPAQGSTLMREGPEYDATKIDPNAAVSQVTLKTLGNTMSDMKYDQTEIRVKAGTTVKLVLVNTAKDSSMQHNFVLIDGGTADQVATDGLKAGQENNYTPKTKSVLTSTKIVGPGMKTEITFPAPEKGTYDFICTYPGHYKMMNGKFIVE